MSLDLKTLKKEANNSKEILEEKTKKIKIIHGRLWVIFPRIF
jgi:hypothetical protein